ncbi:MAG: hypothetical protein ACYTGZ_03620 [Planctomycetota bacterium]|jgi:hypothetical protein
MCHLPRYPATALRQAPGGTENHYCARCRCTQAFRDSGLSLTCPVCEKSLWRATPESLALEAHECDTGRDYAQTWYSAVGGRGALEFRAVGSGALLGGDTLNFRARSARANGGGTH